MPDLGKCRDDSNDNGEWWKKCDHNDNSGDDDDDGSKVVDGLEHKLMFVIFPDLENGGIS